jgi:Nuclease-related domain
MRCIPENPEFGEGQLAEKAVWEALKSSLPDDAVLAHSVQLRDGRNEYEIDLLVLWPNVGMAAIEVKGGQVSIADGQWYQSDRHGKHKIKSPVAQSQSSLHALKNWLEDQLGARLSSRSVYLVSLPYTDVRSDLAMAGCPRTLFLDQTESKSPAELVRRAIENEGGGAARLAPAFLERIVRQLSGTWTPPSYLPQPRRRMKQPRTTSPSANPCCSRQPGHSP